MGAETGVGGEHKTNQNEISLEDLLETLLNFNLLPSSEAVLSLS